MLPRVILSSTTAGAASTMIGASAELAGRQGGKLGPENPEQLLLAPGSPASR
jgi:hypothetical protein